jgi:hypothetical protein
MPGWLRSVGSGPLTWMPSNATSTAWINQHERKGRPGENGDRSRAVRTGSRQRGAGTKGRSLDHLLSGTPIGRIVGPEAMKFGGWQRLNAEFAQQFGVDSPGRPTNTPKR